jgi:hypothetical protein
MWVTLSHCWGFTRHGITTQYNLRLRKRRIDLGHLPTIFRDAVLITRKLGFRYIWIDSLCILQDSVSDWRSESLRMDQYYHNSALNISASSASDSTMSIFETGDRLRGKLKSLTSAECHSALHDIRGLIYLRHGSLVDLDAPLRKRAWVLQESILSHRILWYDADQLRWACNVLYCDEKRPDFVADIGKYRFHKNIFQITTTNRIASSPSISSGSITQSRELESSDLFFWLYGILRDYIHRDITKPEDRLPAIAGLAKEFAKRTKFQYVCGLWKEDLLLGLRWDAHGSKIASQVPANTPSWSWASLHGLELDSSHTVCKWEKHVAGYDAEVVEISIFNENDDAFGQVKSGSLTLKGRW